MRAVGQGGFTLVEALVSMGIMGLVTAMIGAGVFQTVTATEKANAGQQVQGATRNAIAWILRDIPMAQGTDLGDGAPPTNSAAFTWTDYFGDGASSHSVSYALANGDLVRTYDGASNIVGRELGAVSFSRSGRLITVSLASAPKGRFLISDQKVLTMFMRSAV